MKKYIRWFNEISLKDVPLVGGKNASLGEMYQKLSQEAYPRQRRGGPSKSKIWNRGINIPNGFALTSNAFWYYLKFNGIDEKLEEIFGKFEPKSLRSLKETGNQARQLILKGKFPPDLEKEIILNYEKLSKEYGQDFTDVAVRSSATAEDLASIAGNETVLARIGNETKYIEMEKLFYELKENPRPVWVLSFNEDGKIKWTKIEHLYQHPAKSATLYKIITKSGREITISPDHSLVALEPNEFKLKVISISEVDKETRIPVIKHLPLIGNGPRTIDVKAIIKSKPTLIENGRVKIDQKNTLKEQYGLPAKIPINKEFAYFLGIYLAEGSIYEKKNCIDISCDSLLILERVRKFYKSIGSYDDKKIKYKRKVRVQNATLAAFLQEIAGKALPFKGKGRSAKIKYVPDFIFSQSKEIISEFLKGLFDGDGGVSEGGIHYCSLSKKLIGGMVKLLEMFRIKYYLEKNSTNIFIPISEEQQFKKLIGFSEDKNRHKLENLIQKYEKREKYQDFIETFPPSEKISELLEKELKPKPGLTKVKVISCPKCGQAAIKSGTYQDYKNENIKIKRYFCENCQFYFSERSGFSLRPKIVSKYLNYDEFGRYKKGMAPWNKGNRKQLITYGVSYLKKIAEKIKSKELLKIVNSDVIWDKIEKVEPIKYLGHVYDFVVPKTQNFAAGLGGIITHNTASFAGEHETYLNISGPKNLLKAIKKCIASLFTGRAIAYREEKGFEHLKIALSAGIQKMVRSDLASSGVIFTLDTETGFENVVLINSIFGIGEMIVKGKITPDEFYVFKPTLSQGYKSIIVKNLGRKTKKYIYAKGGGLKEIDVPQKDQLKFSLTDEEVLTLAKWGVMIEEHYKIPQDIEWAKDGKTGQLFIVQSRPETVFTPTKIGNDVDELRSSPRFALRARVYEEYKIEAKKKPILTGIAIGNKIGQGKVHIIEDVSKIEEFQKGEVLVTKMTDPDWVPIMRIASAIVTDEGGKTCHAAIIGRELGITAIVGTHLATKILKTDQEITVDCTSGSEGRIFLGRVPFEVKRYDLKEIPKLKTKIMINIGAPDIAFKTSFLPNDGVGLARIEFVLAEKIRIHPLALYHYEKIRDPEGVASRPYGTSKKLTLRQGSGLRLSKIEALKAEIDKLTVGYKDKKQYFIDKLTEGISQIAAAFYPKPVIVRLSDFKTNEYATLIGGKMFEPEESNPMMGWRGASRYYDEKFRPAFEMELKALKKAREEFGLKNIWVMVPFCRTVEEGKKVLDLMAKNGLEKGKDGLKVIVMCEIPSNVILADKFLEIFDGFSIGSNDLTQLVLGLDRDSAIVAKVGDERNEAVKEMVKKVIKICNQKKKYCGICGQAPSDYPEFAQFIMKEGIESMSINPDTVIKTILNLSKTKNLT